jgi:hypothetical protein
MNMRDHESPYRFLAYIICISINIICPYHLPIRRGPTISRSIQSTVFADFRLSVINYDSDQYSQLSSLISDFHSD